MSDDNFSESTKQPSHIAYTVSEGKGDQSHWTKIGAAWPAKDDGLTLKLSSMPLDGRVVLRSRAELEKIRAEKSEGREHARTQADSRSQRP